MNRTKKLMNSLTLHRYKFFEEIAALVPKFQGRIIVITHILEDRPEVLAAISKIGKIELIIAIPYSIHAKTFLALKQAYNVISPSLDEMLNKDYLSMEVDRFISKNDDFIILEIGGYFAQLMHNMKNRFNQNFIGVIESTEAGHRQYEAVKNLPAPVVSVCRGSLKGTEYSVVGNSCIFSVEHLLRQSGVLLSGRKVLVLGYGKVGQGLARGLYKYNCTVMVYDENPIKQVLAYSEGFQTPEKIEAIKEAEIIFGATGNYSLKNEEIKHLKTGAILVSCSSKHIEFDLDYIHENYIVENARENFDVCISGEHFFYLLGKGEPINFIDGAVMGAVLALVQAEIIYAIKTLLELKEKAGIYEVSEDDRKMLAKKWMHYFGYKKSNLLYEYV
jgi:adenosylhomocysteinase